MCGRYTLIKKPDPASLGDQIPPWDDGFIFHPRYNIAPTQDAPVIGSDGGWRMMRWGLVPFWAKDESIGARMINARAETLRQKPAFKRLVTKKRCLVPADGFYEWQKLGATKQPFHFHMKDKTVFFFAGLWDEWTAPDGKSLASFTIITTEANDCTRPVHDRMPVILNRGHVDEWLRGEESSEEAFTALLRPFDAAAMTKQAVNPVVNSPKYDGPECLQLPTDMPSIPKPMNLDFNFDE